MKKWNTTFNNNHLRLMRVHIGFIVFYLILAVIWLYTAIEFGNQETAAMGHIIVAFIFFTPFILLHGLLALGAKKKTELSRKGSEIIFAFLLLGFPVGTLLSMLYFLPRTTWKQSDN